MRRLPSLPVLFLHRKDDLLFYMLIIEKTICVILNAYHKKAACILSLHKDSWEIILSKIDRSPFWWTAVLSTSISSCNKRNPFQHNKSKQTHTKANKRRTAARTAPKQNKHHEHTNSSTKIFLFVWNLFNSEIIPEELLVWPSMPMRRILAHLQAIYRS